MGSLRGEKMAEGINIQEALEKFQQRYPSAKKGENGTRADSGSTAIEHTFDPDLIPDVGPEYERTQEDQAVDDLIGGFDIADAYRRYIGKMEPKVGKRRESVMISCPLPSHPDKNPSAWMNLDKGAWFCAACEQGGDVYDLAAIHKGYNLATYKTDGTFPALRADIAADLGYVERRAASGKTYLEPVIEEPEEPEPVVAEPTAPTPVGTDNEDDERDVELPPSLHIDWRKLLPSHTFLYRWMTETTKDSDLPDEFYFWLGLLAVGAAAGNDVMLRETTPVKGNIFVCLLGTTGLGKSRAVGQLTRLVREALPYDETDDEPTGTLFDNPGSGEALYEMFSKPLLDPATGKVTDYAPIRGCMKVDEFATIARRAASSISTLKQALIAIYDGWTDSYRTRSSGYMMVKDPFGMCVTTSQIKTIHDVLTSTDLDNGFLNRFFFVFGRTKKMDHISHRSPDVGRLVDSLRELRTWSRMAGSTRMLEWNSESEPIWKAFFYDKIEPLKRRNDDDSAAMARIDLHLKKLALLFSINEKQSTLTKENVERAISLFDYLQFSYAQLVTGVSLTTVERDTDKVRSIIQRYHEKNDKWPTANDMRRFLRMDNVTLAKTLEAMVKIGEVEIDAVKGARGRVGERYRLV
jgi:hypothetical protein